MKFWFDTEFIEDGRTIDLISIGIVAEDGRELYAISLDCDWSKASDWVRENVLSQLPPKPEVVGTLAKRIDHSWYRRYAIAEAVIEFCNPDKFGKPEFWAYYADYDWVVFCQLFGTMMDLPKGFPMYCRDIKQECDRLGNPKLPQQQERKHHALADARWTRDTYLWLQGNYNHPTLA
jgi:3' exoribonuclease, RNase T-like